jgi:flavorubredoxin
MAKVVVVYDSLFGNTKAVAESIIEGMKQVSGIETTLGKPKEVDLKQITEYDAILVGSPNHMGGATMSVRRFIGKLGKMNLEGKLAAVFDTYFGKALGQAVKKMEKQINQKAPGLKLVTPGLSIKVEGLRGPIAEGELSKCKEFGAKIANQLKGKA